jgi:hypothetical protein
MIVPGERVDEPKTALQVLAEATTPVQPLPEEGSGITLPDTLERMTLGRFSNPIEIVHGRMLVDPIKLAKRGFPKEFNKLLKIADLITTAAKSGQGAYGGIAPAVIPLVGTLAAPLVGALAGKLAEKIFGSGATYEVGNPQDWVDLIEGIDYSGEGIAGTFAGEPVGDGARGGVYWNDPRLLPQDRPDIDWAEMALDFYQPANTTMEGLTNRPAPISASGEEAAIDAAEGEGMGISTRGAPQRPGGPISYRHGYGVSDKLRALGPPQGVNYREGYGMTPYGVGILGRVGHPPPTGGVVRPSRYPAYMHGDYMRSVS